LDQGFSRRKFLVLGLAPFSNRGDLLQYVVSLELCMREFGLDNITSIGPIQGNEELFTDSLSFGALRGAVSFKEGLSEVFSIPYLFEKLVPNYQRFLSVLKADVNGGENPVSSPHVKTGFSNAIYHVLWSLKYEHNVNHALIEYLWPAMARSWFGMIADAGVISGHTIEREGFYNYITNYILTKRIVKKGVGTFPISVSALGLKARGNDIGFLRLGLKRLDFIFARGPYSERTFTTLLGCKGKTFRALDSGFGLRLIYERPKWNSGIRNLRIVIVPSYMHAYMHEQYRRGLTRLVSWVFSKFDCEFYLMPFCIDASNETKDVRAVNDILSASKGRLTQELKSIKVVDTAHMSIHEIYEFFGSVDVVVTSRMHAGIMAMSAGTPALFLVPKDDTKILDVLASLGLDTRQFLIDTFNPKEMKDDNVQQKFKSLVDNISTVKQTIDRRIEEALPSVKLPLSYAKNLIESTKR